MAHIVTEETSEEVSEQPAIEITKRQSLAPLLVLGVATAAMGFYVVFSTRGEDLGGGGEERALLEGPRLQVEAPQQGIDAKIPAVELFYKFPYPQRHRYQLSQKSERRVAEQVHRAQTQLAFTLASRPAEKTESLEGATWREVELEVGGFRAQVGDGDTLIGGSVLSQLESVVEGRKARVKKSGVGRTRDFEWLGEANPQTLHAREILRDNILLLAPRFPRQVLKVGESWTYEVPFGGPPRKDGNKLTGKLIVRSELVGQATFEGSPVVIIKQQLRLSGGGSFTPEASGEEGAAPITFEMSGSGKGLVHFNQEVGVLHRYDVMLDQRLDIAQSGSEAITQDVRYELQTTLER